MRNITFWSGFGFALFTLLAIISILISIVTFTYHEITRTGFIGFLAEQHLWIMLITIFLSIGYGFSWSYFLQKQILQEQNTSKTILEIVISFLSIEESDVLKHLVENKGKSSQSKIAHIGEMGAVKALRTVQKMKEKRIVSIQKEGKMRLIKLNNEILELLE